MMKTKLFAIVAMTTLVATAYAAPGDPMLNAEGNVVLDTKINAELVNGRQGMTGAIDVGVGTVSVGANMTAFSTKAGSQIVGAIAQEGGGVINLKKDLTIKGDINHQMKNNQGDTQVVNAIYQRGSSVR
jgi:hypothetical protein